MVCSRLFRRTTAEIFEKKCAGAFMLNNIKLEGSTDTIINFQGDNHTKFRNNVAIEAK